MALADLPKPPAPTDSPQGDHKPAARAPVLPDAASFDVGACLGIPVMTAHRAVFADGDVKNQTILVTGGAGRVGYYAIQLAVEAGANVIVTACPFCLVNMEDAIKVAGLEGQMEAIDLAELVAAQLA